MQSAWNDTDAGAAVHEQFADSTADIALRVYTSRLIGADASLVLHGGGNTSVKTQSIDLLGREREVVCVKGSGHDLATIDPRGFPALDLEGLRELRAVDELADQALLDQLRVHLLDPNATTPSLETLVHAFIPDKFVDHTHADVVLTFVNRPRGADELVELFDGRVTVVDWVMPGLPLAKAVADARDENPDLIGIVLDKHGVITWGPDARTSYERMIEVCDRVEKEIATRLGGRPVFEARDFDRDECHRAAVEVASTVRRFLAAPRDDVLNPCLPLIAEWRVSAEILAAAERADAVELFRAGPLTPDHALRTKGWYCVSDPDAESLAVAIAGFSAAYLEGFNRHGPGADHASVLDDPFPRVMLVRGVGLFGFGPTKKAARIAADIAEHTVHGKLTAAALSSYEALCDSDVFRLEYWPPERAKLGGAALPALAGKVAIVTGGAGAIGRATCRMLLERGCHVVLTDLPGDPLENTARELRGRFGDAVHAQPMDVTDEASVKQVFDDTVLQFGGLDIVVANAGIAHVGSIDSLSLRDWQRVHAVNETGTFLCFREAARRFKAQGLGGRLVLNASKNVPAPGADFAAYSASKAGAVQVARVAALELAELGVTVNLVHADGVFEDEASGKSSGLWDTVGPERMASRGLDSQGLREFYKNRNLMKVPVSARHVAEAITFFAEGRTPTTGAALTVDGGHRDTFYR